MDDPSAHMSTDSVTDRSVQLTIESFDENVRGSQLVRSSLLGDETLVSGSHGGLSGQRGCSRDGVGVVLRHAVVVSCCWMEGVQEKKQDCLL